MENTLKPNLDKTQWANWPILWSVFRLVCAVSILLFREQFLPYIHIFLRPCLMCSARSGWRWFPWAEASALMQSIAGGSLFQHFDGKQRCPRLALVCKITPDTHRNISGLYGPTYTKTRALHWCIILPGLISAVNICGGESPGGHIHPKGNPLVWSGLIV